MKYVLHCEDGFYKGTSYIYQGEVYANVGGTGEAKYYKSKAIANKAMESINKKAVNYTFEMREVVE